MDEIDAALDFKNVSIVANYIKVRLIFMKWLHIKTDFPPLLMGV